MLKFSALYLLGLCAANSEDGWKYRIALDFSLCNGMSLGLAVRDNISSQQETNKEKLR